MKPKLFIFTFSFLSLTFVTFCKNPSNKLKTDALNAEIKNNKTMDKEQLTGFGKNILRHSVAKNQRALQRFLRLPVH